MILRTLIVGDLATNCYVLGCEETHEGLVVDPGGDGSTIVETVAELGLTVRFIVLTHYHFDHVLAVPEVRSVTGAPVAIHEREGTLLSEPPDLFRMFAPRLPQGLAADRLLRGGDVIEAGGLSAEVLETPGHSPGGISLWLVEEGCVLTGDALFREGLGRTDFPGSSPDALMRSIREVLFALPDEARVFPGHGPPSTVGHEKRHNPWVRGTRA